MLLVQAVSQHRQRRPNDSVVSLANLISAYRAVPEQSGEGGSVGVVQWGEREELKDLYAIFCDKVRYVIFHIPCYITCYMTHLPYVCNMCSFSRSS
jgi:hypothetical protein